MAFHTAASDLSGIRFVQAAEHDVLARIAGARCLLMFDDGNRGRSGADHKRVLAAIHAGSPRSPNAPWNSHLALARERLRDAKLNKQRLNALLGARTGTRRASCPAHSIEAPADA